MKKWLLSVLFILGAIFPIYADNDDDDDDLDKAVLNAPKISLILPVNWSATNPYNFAATIPGEFRPLTSLSDWGNTESTILEFIPKSEEEYDWSQIITLVKYVGKKISAKDAIDNLKKTLLSQVENGKILQEDASKKADYETASFALAYDSEGRHEVIDVQYYSGPYDLAGIQYTIRPAAGESDKDVLKKMNTFFKDQTSIISGDKTKN